MAPSVDQNEKDLLAAVDRVGDWQGKAFRYEPVKGGITNPNWKVVVGDSAFFVKIPGHGTEVFIDRRNCHAANLIAQQAGIGPSVCYFFEDYDGPRNLDSVLSYTWEQKRGGPSGEFEEEAHTVI